MIIIKSLEECLQEGLIVKSSNYVGYTFCHVESDPGLEYSMLNMLGKVYYKYETNNRLTEYRIQDEFGYIWYWPKEVICKLNTTFKKLKII